MSSFSKIANVETRMARLAQDLSNGSWHERNRAIIDAESLDLGYRVLTFELAARD